MACNFMHKNLFRSVRPLVLLVGLTSSVGVAQAHHSFAMFDATQSVTAEGTVQELQWTNPHVWLNVVVPQSDGTSKTLVLELNGISGLLHSGWKPRTLKPADKIKVTYHPLRDGSPGGQLIELINDDGTLLKGQ
jgi:hypothetical protein